MDSAEDPAALHQEDENPEELYDDQQVNLSSEIPKKYQFQDMEFYTIKINWPSYEDPVFAYKKFVSNYNSTLTSCNKVLAEINTKLAKAQTELSQCFQRNLTAKTRKYVAVNGDAWRYQVILFQKKTKLEKRYYEHIICKYLQSRAKIMKLIELANYLKKYPRSMVFNRSRIHSLVQANSNYMIEDLLKIKALEVLLSDVKVMQVYTPKLALQPSERLDFIKTQIMANQFYRDPLTNYLPETEYFGTFITLLNSRFELKKRAKTDPIDKLIEYSVIGMCEITKLNSEEFKHLIKELASRYWFNKLHIFENFYKIHTNDKLNQYLVSLRNISLKDLGIPKKLAKCNNFKNPIDIFQFDKSICDAAVDTLYTAMYYTVPNDIANQYYLIDLILSGVLAKLLKKSIDHKDVRECIPFMWKILFIFSNVQLIDAPLHFVMEYQTVNNIPPKLVEKCKAPFEVLKSFLSNI